MIEMLEMGSARPTAIFVASDIQAMGAMTALRDNGLKVPDDMAIVGFDDIELAQHIGLTTVRQPMYEMGVLAVGRILDRMTDRNGSVTHTTFTPKLIVRESCGAVKEKYVSSNNVMD